MIWHSGLRWVICPLLVIVGHVGLVWAFLSSKPPAPQIQPSLDQAAAPIVVEMALPTATQQVSIQQIANTTPLEQPEKIIEKPVLDIPVKEIATASAKISVQSEKKPEPKRKEEPRKKPEPRKKQPPKLKPKTNELPIPTESMENTVRLQDNNVERKSDLNRALETGAANMAQSQAQRSWESDILARLQKEKRYPAYALRSKQQDTVLVRFIIDNEGNVLSSSIVKSHGYDSLDRESVALIKRVSPLPPPPPNVIKGNSMEMVVPIEFFIRQSAS